MMPLMTRIVAIQGALPAQSYGQEQITRAVADLCLAPERERERGVLARVHAASQVRRRHLALPLERYAALTGFGQSNDAFIEVALRLGEEAVRGALEQSGLRADEIDLVVFTSVTGIAAPSIEARLAGPLGLRPDVKRVPVFGLGCVAGAAGIARLHDYLHGHPDQVALLLSVELCSLTLQRADASPQNLVAGALFGDGAAALLAVGGDRADRSRPAGPTVVATRSRLFPGTERMLGWEIGDNGFRILLGADLPDLVRDGLGEEVRSFLADHDLKTQDVTAWVCHPGGPKVLDAVRETLDLPARALELTWRSLAEVGNLSSASVLHILEQTIAAGPPAAGSFGVMIGLGPGVSAELVLMQW